MASSVYSTVPKEPIFEEEIPDFYGKDIDQVELHMNKVYSHTSTAAYSEKKESEKEYTNGLLCFRFTYLILLKRALGKWHPSTPNGLQKTIQEEWSKI
ncbi:hypothetical protein TNCV_3386821 [Trichonephila clavipes]|nr:hypothetical protein TNCV_3386821 [Trichonephila clavipes]